MATTQAPSTRDRFVALLDPGRVIDHPLERRLYARDGSIAQGDCGLVVLPETPAEVVACMRLAHDLGLPVVPRGSGTGLCGGAVPLDGAIVLSVARMSRILEIEPGVPCARVEPGVLNLDLSTAVAHLGLHYAPDPSSQQACSIGGNVATNAGGPHCLASGVTAQHILGMEIVLADGEVLRLGGTAPDPPGYDLRGFVVGGEGTLGVVTEEFNRAWYQRNSGQTVKDVQRRVRHPVHGWMAATLDGIVEQTGAVFEAKFMLPWTFTEEAAAEKHMAQLQHNMWVTASRSAVLSIITGGGKWVEMTIHADPLYQHLLLTAEKKFWRCVLSGDLPRLFGVEPPRPRLEAVRIVDMSSSNLWAEPPATYVRTRSAYGEHELAKAELKKLVPEDAKEAAGHGIRARRSKSGAISFDLQQAGGSDAQLQ